MMNKLSNRNFFQNSGDCSMFVVKAMEFMSHDIDLLGVKQEDMNMHRQQLTIDLYRHGAVKLATHVGSDMEIDEN